MMKAYCMVTVGIKRREYLQEIILKENGECWDSLTIENEEFLLATLVLDQINGADPDRSRGSWE